MKLKKFTSFFIFFFMLANIILPGYMKASAAGTSRVFYSIDLPSIAAGQDFNIYVNAENISNFYGGSIDFCYDPTLMQVNSVQAGSFFNNLTSGTDYYLINQGPSNGTVSLGLTLLGNKYPTSGINITTASQLFVIKATALKAGSVTLKTITDNSNLSATGNNVRINLADSNGAKITGVTYDTQDINIFKLNATRIEETNTDITYSGSWSANPNSGYSGGSSVATSSALSSASFSFTGTGISFISAMGNNVGIVKVYIDNVAYPVDLYSSTTKLGKLVFLKTDLADGTHTFKVENTGTKNAASTGTYAIIDGFDIVGGSIVAKPTPKRVEENNPNITYAGSWLANPNSAYSKGSSMATSAALSSASFSFTGTGISFISAMGNNVGIVKVYIDNVPYPIDLYSSTTQLSKVVFSKSGLASGTHTLKVENTGTKSATSSGTYAIVDAFDITGGDIVAKQPDPTGIIIEENNSNITYSGSWSTNPNSAYSKGSSMATSAALSSASFSFTGTGIKFYSAMGSNVGIVKVYIDNVPYTVDLYSSATQLSKIVFSKFDLAAGTHTVKVENTGTKSASSSGTYAIVDAFEIIGGDIVTKPSDPSGTRIEENNTNITYSGSWSTNPNSGYSLGASMATSAALSSASFSFTGTGIKFYSAMGNNVGIVKVYIDNVPYIVDLYSSSTQLSKIVFTKLDLAAGTHTLKVENTGTKSPSSSGTYAIVDAFEIIGGGIVTKQPDPTGIRIEENNTNITYSGSWSQNPNSGYSLGASMATSAALSSASFSFTGTGIKFYSAMGSNVGIIKIYIDNVPYTVDLYSSSTQLSKIVFTKYDLAAGTHTIKVENTGTKSSVSSGTYAIVDAFEIIGGNIVSKSGSSITRIEENDSKIVYTGSWSVNPNSGYSYGSSKCTNTVGSMSFTFTGTGISFLSAMGANVGIVKIYIDNVLYNVDLYSANTQLSKSVFSKTGLADGTHTIRIENTGTKNPLSTGTYAIIDAFDIIGGTIK